MVRQSIKYVVDIDLNKNYLKKARFENLAEAPADPEEGQVYYNTTEKCFYFFHGSSWEKFVKTSELLTLLNDTLIAGDGVDIKLFPAENPTKLQVSVKNKSALYVKEFGVSDWTNGVMTITKAVHQCGAKPVLQEVMEYVTVGDKIISRAVEVGFEYNDDGDVTLYSSEGFVGYLQIGSPYSDPVPVESSLNDILYGPVSE